MISLLNITEKDNAVIQTINHPDQDMKQRFYDLGFYPRTLVKKVLTSPKRDPIAYRVRGTTIAIRNYDAAYVEVMIQDGHDS